LRPMTRLAGNSLVHAFALHLDNIAMARLAGLVSGIGNRQDRNLCDRFAAIMPILPKTGGDKDATQYQENKNPSQEYGCHAEEMSCVFEGLHVGIRNSSFWTDFLWPLGLHRRNGLQVLRGPGASIGVATQGGELAVLVNNFRRLEARVTTAGSEA
jgi:hypothetical protein